MTHRRTYSAVFLLLLFCCYYSGISMFSHVHIINGASVVHSHLGGNAEHEHSESQYAIIDILSHFQTEAAIDHYVVGSPFVHSSELLFEHQEPSYINEEYSVYALRGPPQA